MVKSQHKQQERRFRWHASAVILFGCLLLAAGIAQADETPPVNGRTNLAAGKTVQFSPEPLYGPTHKNNTDATDLTDGVLSQQYGSKIWFDPKSVGWSYAGRVNMAVDLGQVSSIDEVAIRFVGGSPQGTINMPGWVEVLVSDDGEHYRKVKEFSRFSGNAFEQYSVPRDEGDAWVHCLRFTDLNAQGRWVGIRLTCPAYMATDELWVFGQPLTNWTPQTIPYGSGFTIKHPQPHFHKPYLQLATNLPLPVPLGLTAATAGAPGGADPVEFTLKLPAGVSLVGGDVGDIPVANGDWQTLPDGSTQIHFHVTQTSNNVMWGRLYLQAPGWVNGQFGVLQYWSSQGAWTSQPVVVPLFATQVEAAPELQTLMVGLGWWSTVESLAWPDVLNTWRTLGINSFAMSAYDIASEPDTSPSWLLRQQAVDQGFKITNHDSTFHRMIQKHKNDPSIYCQFAGGAVSAKLCPSYRGPHFDEEIERFADLMVRAKPDISTLDLEMFSNSTLADAQQCTRCQADFQASGLATWEQWLKLKGDEMCQAAVQAARQALMDEGADPDFHIGGYDFRPGHVFKNVFSFDSLYPRWLDQSEVSTYTPLFPYQLGFIGDEVRADRSQMPRSDVMPWITPGDAGTFPGTTFQWALLECYTNGARGVWFWSSRMIDSEDLIAYNRVVRAIAPVEDVIVEGDLVGDAAQVVGAGRVSGVRHDHEMVLLAADYFGDTSGSVQLTLELPAPSKVVDLFTGVQVGDALDAGSRSVTVPLNGQRARLLHVLPVE